MAAPALLLALRLASSGTPGAPPPLTPEQMLRGSSAAYFAGEKREGYVWLSVGALALSGGAAAYALGGEVGRGAAWPLWAFGLVQLGLGAGLLYRTDAQVASRQALLERPGGLAAFRADEGERMRRVNRGFDVYKWVELGAVATGSTLAGVGAGTGHPTLRGVGLGLAAQGLVMIAFDHFAEQRARIYAEAIERLTGPAQWERAQ